MITSHHMKLNRSNAFSLPPNVDGRCRAQLAFNLTEVNWHYETTNPFVGIPIHARIIWWGENQLQAAIIRLTSSDRKSKSMTGELVLRYYILTKIKLFRDYLTLCEPIELKFSSATTNLQIGTAFIQIPFDLIESLDTSRVTQINRPTLIGCTSEIFNLRNKIIGNIKINFQLTIYDRTSPRSIESLSIDRTFVTSQLQKSPRDTNKNVCMDDNRQKSSQIKSKQTKNIDNLYLGRVEKSHLEQLSSHRSIGETRKLSSRIQNASPLFDYLSGRPLTRHQEAEALKEMENVSPTESLIDEIETNLKAKISSPRKIRQQLLENVSKLSPKVDAFDPINRIDSIRLTVLNLTLTKAGLRELTNRKNIDENAPLVDSSFTVECQIDPQLNKRSKKSRHHHNACDAIRFVSRDTDSFMDRIVFNGEVVRSISNASRAGAFAVITFVIWFRSAKMQHSEMIGTSSVRFMDVLNANNNFTLNNRCAIRTTTGHIVVGLLDTKIEVGCRGIHFGVDFLDAISIEPTIENDCQSIDSCAYTVSCRDCCCNQTKRSMSTCFECQKLSEHEQRIDEMIANACIYGLHENQPSDGNKEVMTTSAGNEIATVKLTSNDLNSSAAKHEKHINEPKATDSSAPQVLPNQPKDDEIHSNLNGLFYVGLINFNQSDHRHAETFLVCRPFWNNAAVAILTEHCRNNVLNFLESFHVESDASFFERTKFGFMDVEVWQRRNATQETDTFVGIAKLPLHQFHIAFYDANVRRHVTKQKSPVISIDGWASIMTSTSPTPVGTLQVILSIGTDEQTNYLKKSRNLSPCKTFLRSPPEILPTLEHVTNPIQSKSLPSVQSSVRPPSGLNSFIESLATRLPDCNQRSMNQSPSSIPSTVQSKSSGQTIRATSDLLDELQRALTISPSPTSTMSAMPFNGIESISYSKKATKMPQFNVLIEIENALHLPTVPMRVHKKDTRRCLEAHTVDASNTTLRTSGSGSSVREIEPCTYVTFEAIGPPTSIVNSNEGPVYTTNVAENSCNPQWNKRFDVFLPVDLLHDDNKRFVLRVWRKTSNEILQARLLPNPMEDVIVGFVAIDLTVLMAGMPSITGWFNVVDYSSRINGQIKIGIQPKEDVKKYRQLSSEIRTCVGRTEDNNCTTTLKEASSATAASTQHLMNAVSDEIAADHTILSRTLKRKFTELEEITERLRARLFDVTGDADIDPDDQFEIDLNTLPDEDDEYELAIENDANANDLDWLKMCQEQQKRINEIDFRLDQDENNENTKTDD